ncbi:MAG: hypothetical protein ACYCQI_10405 [Gammaproteobacteria bacterium]
MAFNRSSDEERELELLSSQNSTLFPLGEGQLNSLVLNITPAIPLSDDEKSVTSEEDQSEDEESDLEAQLQKIFDSTQFTDELKQFDEFARLEARYKKIIAEAQDQEEESHWKAELQRVIHLKNLENEYRQIAQEWNALKAKMDEDLAKRLALSSPHLSPIKLPSRKLSDKSKEKKKLTCDELLKDFLGNKDFTDGNYSKLKRYINDLIKDGFHHQEFLKQLARSSDDPEVRDRNFLSASDLYKRLVVMLQKDVYVEKLKKVEAEIKKNSILCSEIAIENNPFLDGLEDSEGQVILTKRKSKLNAHYQKLKENVTIYKDLFNSGRFIEGSSSVRRSMVDNAFLNYENEVKKYKFNYPVSYHSIFAKKKQSLDVMPKLANSPLYVPFNPESQFDVQRLSSSIDASQAEMSLAVDETVVPSQSKPQVILQVQSLFEDYHRKNSIFYFHWRHHDEDAKAIENQLKAIYEDASKTPEQMLNEALGYIIERKNLVEAKVNPDIDGMKHSSFFRRAYFAIEMLQAEKERLLNQKSNITPPRPAI